MSDKKSKLSTFFTVQQSNKPSLSFDENISSWVLSDFSSDEKIKWVDETINKISKNISSLINNKDCF